MMVLVNPNKIHRVIHVVQIGMIFKSACKRVKQRDVLLGLMRFLYTYAHLRERSGSEEEGALLMTRS